MSTIKHGLAAVHGIVSSSVSPPPRKSSNSVLYLWIIMGFLCPSVVVGQLTGDIKKCQNEGEEVFIPLITTNPCIRCFCKSKIVQCERTTCASLDGCYMILSDVASKQTKCCQVCKGCSVAGKDHESGTHWVAENDPCTSYYCKAGVASRTTTQCYTPCKNPIHVPGQCCPVCTGCNYNKMSYAEGATFTLKQDPCTQCLCQNGNVTCQKQACPVLNCPPNSIYTPEGACCPVCKGQRRIFNLPGGRCFFRKRVYKSGQDIKIDNCTSCVCIDGTLTCDRKSCPPLTCSSDKVTWDEGACCPRCPNKNNCHYRGKTYLHAQTWNPDVCTSCSCDDGSTRCRVQNCGKFLWCPAGYKLRYIDGECCPKCTEAKGVCTVFGDPHYRTFDGRIYNFQGPCKYLLAEDTEQKTFSVRVRNDARTSPWFTWTRMVMIVFGNNRITLHQRLKVKVNRQTVKLPYNNHAEFSVIKDGQSVKVSSNLGVKVVWDGDSFVELTVPSSYKGRLRGLCGNYNGVGTDDLIGKDRKLYYEGESFGQTWRVGGKSTCMLSNKVQTEAPPCGEDKDRLRASRKLCSHLLSGFFGSCRQTLDVEQYYMSCMADMCDCPEGKNCACESFKAYARACVQEGVPLSIKHHEFCPDQCPKGAYYRKCTRKCMRTCDDLDKNRMCRDDCIPGCACPGKFVLHKNRCIKPRLCPKR